MSHGPAKKLVNVTAETKRPWKTEAAASGLSQTRRGDLRTEDIGQQEFNAFMLDALNSMDFTLKRMLIAIELMAGSDLRQTATSKHTRALAVINRKGI